MGNGVLSYDGCAVAKAGADVVGEIGVDCGDDFGGVHACYGTEEVDSSFERPGEETGAS